MAIHEHWKTRVREIHVADKRLSLRGIQKKLQQEAAPEDAGEPPWPASIRTIINDTANLEGYHTVSWPESFGRYDLPWEAAPVVRELTARLGVRPSVDHAVWFYRLTVAAPEATFHQRQRAAYWLSRAAQRGDSDDLFNRGQAIMQGRIADVLDEKYTPPAPPAPPDDDEGERRRAALAEQKRMLRIHDEENAE